MSEVSYSKTFSVHTKETTQVKSGQRRKPVTFSLDDRIKTILASHCKDNNYNKSTLVESLIIKYLQEQGVEIE
ncbi:hypothetical protein BN1058_01693 [Paraliobacillus sp. PM-2]|uniref:hypothetical protein n=1 Tax=Paraliobacillus sp. PM-2 TaxID=1462524 RepID=UPI00061CDAB6|nr:hypothetical protein [Paraliobacillus sp. PM-2]CQR47382.1 hypothetical protein BN1058_01693 [Paraliobacillus sp. PM-2]